MSTPDSGQNEYAKKWFAENYDERGRPLQRASDLATLERLLRCRCGGWLNLHRRILPPDEVFGHLAVCPLCGRSAFKADPALAILAYHEERGHG